MNKNAAMAETTEMTGTTHLMACINNSTPLLSRPKVNLYEPETCQVAENQNGTAVGVERWNNLYWLCHVNNYYCTRLCS